MPYLVGCLVARPEPDNRKTTGWRCGVYWAHSLEEAIGILVSAFQVDGFTVMAPGGKEFDLVSFYQMRGQ